MAMHSTIKPQCLMSMRLLLTLEHQLLVQDMFLHSGQWWRGVATACGMCVFALWKKILRRISEEIEKKTHPSHCCPSTMGYMA